MTSKGFPQKNRNVQGIKIKARNHTQDFLLLQPRQNPTFVGGNWSKFGISPAAKHKSQLLGGMTHCTGSGFYASAWTFRLVWTYFVKKNKIEYNFSIYSSLALHASKMDENGSKIGVFGSFLVHFWANFDQTGSGDYFFSYQNLLEALG